MDNVEKIKGKDIWELFKLQNKFFEEIHSIIKTFDENLDKDEFKLINKNLLDSKKGINDYDRWSPLGIQFSFKRKDERICINFIFRELDIEEISYIGEPLLLISKYKLNKIKVSHEYDNYNLIDKLEELKKFKLNEKINLKGISFEGNDISNGFFKAVKLLEIKTKNDIISICTEINSWKYQ